MHKPTRDDLEAAKAKLVPDILSADLDVLFVGINPGLYSAAIEHHFGRPGNRFWPALHLGGFTERQLTPYEESELLERKLGITNVVARSSARADELTREELLAGAKILESKVLHFRPRYVAILGVTAYRTAFAKPEAKLGQQDELLGDAIVWILPNPSGLNAHYQLPDLGRLFAELREVAQPRSKVNRATSG
jgi:TDG/mug DNA glycosylase family protein